uniref:Uncharacterized protein n=1 Tax=Leersia perrieri TaxID=77586 RepID=A0A0D9X3X5_9ORYZ
MVLSFWEKFWYSVAVVVGFVGVVFGLIFLIRKSLPPPRTISVVKLQVALGGVAAAKLFQKDLNKIAERVEGSSPRWYKFILTDSDSWNDHFNKISLDERSKFDEETLSNLEGIKRKKEYSTKTDGSKNEYIVLTILVAADGKLDFPEVIGSAADLEVSLAKLYSTPQTDLEGVHVLWAPQDEDDVLSKERMQKDYPYLKPLSNKADDQNSTHESVGTAASPPPPPVTVNPYARFCSNVALASGVIGALFLIARFCPSTHVIKLQVALRGNAAVKSLQKDLNKIAERTDDSNERWYKFILTETISSLRCHKDCCISTSLTVDVKYSIDWKDHFEKISMEERSKFDEETLSNLQGIKRKKVYSKKTDGSKNEYIVLTILVAANGILDFPQVIRSVADLETALAKLNSTPETDLWGMHVLWAPQDEDDILSAERIQKDYPYQKPLSSL